MRTFLSSKVLFVFFLVSLLIVPCVAQAQNIDQAVRQTDVLDRQEKEKVVQDLFKKRKEKPSIEIPTGPAVEGEKKFFIKKIEIIGCESLGPEKFTDLLAKYENKELSLTDLKTLAKAIEQIYLDNDMIAAAIIPPQEIKNETATIQVVEARFGELLIQDHKYFRKNRLKYYWKIAPGDVISYDKISKSVQLMSRNPDREVRVALQAGKQPKTTDAVLTAKTKFPVHFTSTFDNAGSVSTGKGRQGYGIKHNNLLGFDDTLTTGSTFGNHFYGYYAYHMIPVSSNGTAVLYGYSHSESRPKKEFSPFALNSFADNASIGIYQDLYKKDENRGIVFAEFAAKDKTVKMNTGVYSRDRLRIIKLAGDFIFRTARSIFTLSPEFSQGLTAFGASSMGNPLASRGARPDFTKFIVGTKYKRILPLNIQLNARLKGQIASTKLTPQEEMSLGGIDSVRGYPDSDYLADNAIIESVELVFPAFFVPSKIKMPFSEKNLKENVSFVMFSDYGWGMRRAALSTEKRQVYYVSAGTGLRINLFDKAAMRLEWGFPLGANRAITEHGDSQFHFSVDFQY